MVKVGMGPYLSLFSLLASFFFMPGCDADFECPSGWLLYKGQCYGVFLNKYDWTKAELNCQSLGKSSHLVSILLESEAEALSRYISNTYPTIDTIWIGLRDKLKNGRWRWADSATSMFSPWVDEKPKDINESGFCAYLSKEQEFRKWNDTFCNTEMPFVCGFSL